MQRVATASSLNLCWLSAPNTCLYAPRDRDAIDKKSDIAIDDK